ncbi:MAG TPA: hypothetical protein PKD53_16720 [Chloroflexaceae bacterium]|nr:hypothetical protein [Chloroflexaceae bacterium]
MSRADLLATIIEWPDHAPPAALRRYWPRFSMRGRCRRCGCTARRGCRPRQGRSCWWTNRRQTLCSRCVAYPGRRRYRRPQLGHARAAQIRAWYADRAELHARATWLRWEARHTADDTRRELLLALAAAAERRP